MDTGTEKAVRISQNLASFLGLESVEFAPNTQTNWSRYPNYGRWARFPLFATIDLLEDGDFGFETRHPSSEFRSHNNPYLALVPLERKNWQMMDTAYIQFQPKELRWVPLKRVATTSLTFSIRCRDFEVVKCQSFNFPFALELRIKPRLLLDFSS